MRRSCSRFQTVRSVSGSLHFTGDAVDELLERVGSGNIQEAAPVSVGVDIDDGFARQLGGVVLGPFGGTKQALPLRRPTRNKQWYASAASLAQQNTQAASFFHERAGPRDRV